MIQSKDKRFRNKERPFSIVSTTGSERGIKINSKRDKQMKGVIDRSINEMPKDFPLSSLRIIQLEL